MAILTITIRGIALVTQDGDTWNIYMPFGGCHHAEVKRAESEPGIRLNHPGQRLRVSVTGGRPTLIQGRDFDEFFDITGPDAHEDGVSLVDGWDREAVLFSVPGGTYSAQVSFETYSVTQVTDPLAVKKDLGRVGTIGTIVVSGEEISLIAEGQENFTWDFSENSTIYIDNDCHGVVANQNEQSPDSEAAPLSIDGKDNNKRDFQMLYQVIKDARAEGRRFQVQSETGADLPCNNHRATKFI